MSTSQKSIEIIAILCLVFWASLVSAENYRVISQIKCPKDIESKVELVNLSPDGDKLAYVIITGGKRSLWLNDKKLLFGDTDSEFFSLSGKRLAYTVKRAGKWSVWIDERKISPEFDSI